MLLPRLREEVLEANLELVRRGLVLYTFGNASAISREQKFVVIKPSGVPYDKMKPEHLVVTDLEGKVVEGDLKEGDVVITGQNITGASSSSSSQNNSQTAPGFGGAPRTGGGGARRGQ